MSEGGGERVPRKVGTVPDPCPTRDGTRTGTVPDPCPTERVWDTTKVSEGPCGASYSAEASEH